LPSFPVRTPVCEILGIEHPIVAFSNVPAVVAEVSAQGGMGVLGTGVATPDELAAKLDWLDSKVPGRYGVDILFPVTGQELSEQEAMLQIPAENREFVRRLMEELGLKPPTEVGYELYGGGHVLTNARAVELTEVSLTHELACFATAIGPTPPDLMGRLKDRSIPVIGMAGTPHHALRQVEVGADIVVAQGTEAGGHTGEISTMVLVPQVVDLVHPTPVLAAGGIGNGRQMAASLALGAQGVWTGSIWLTTEQYGLTTGLRDRLLKATSRDTVRTRALTGKPVRMLRNDWMKAWDSPGAPRALPSPLQGLLVRDALAAALEQGAEQAMSTPIGQVVGQMNEAKTVAEVFAELLSECAATCAALAGQPV
jgi:NAD(P)H-dependent flavin oxidoreductase YrpB (nitropropane dioxygenase family)